MKILLKNKLNSEYSEHKSFDYSGNLVEYLDKFVGSSKNYDDIEIERAFTEIDFFDIDKTLGIDYLISYVDAETSFFDDLDINCQLRVEALVLNGLDFVDAIAKQHRVSIYVYSERGSLYRGDIYEDLAKELLGIHFEDFESEDFFFKELALIDFKEWGQRIKENGNYVEIRNGILVNLDEQQYK